MKEIERGYRIVVTRKSSKNTPETKPQIPRALMNKLSYNQLIKKIKVHEKFCIKVLNSTREAIMMERMNDNILWADDTTKEMSAL